MAGFQAGGKVFQTGNYSDGGPRSVHADLVSADFKALIYQPVLKDVISAWNELPSHI